MKQKAEIYESMIGFEHNSFRNRIKDELAYSGETREQLSKNCHIKLDRLKYLLEKKNTDFKRDEINKIKKHLGM